MSAPCKSSARDEESWSINDHTEKSELHLDSFIDRVEEAHRRDHLKAIQKLTLDNSRLQHLIIKYQDYQCMAVDLLEIAQNALLRVQKALELTFNQNRVAEMQWLSFWSIPAKHSKRFNYSPAGWI